MQEYPAKQCTICGRMWQPKSRYQWVRNLTCSPECNSRRISKQRTGQPSAADRRVTIPCATCGKPVKLSPSRVKRIANPTCSRSCNGKQRALALIQHSGNMKGRTRKDPRYGEANPSWKGGVTYFRKHGNYKPIKYVRCPLDLIEMARQDGYVMEHRLIMARLTRYPLLRREVVHHVDHDPHNNEPTNLELWPTNQDHKLWEGGRFVPGVACRVYLTVSVQP